MESNMDEIRIDLLVAMSEADRSEIVKFLPWGKQDELAFALSKKASEDALVGPPPKKAKVVRLLSNEVFIKTWKHTTGFFTYADFGAKDGVVFKLLPKLWTKAGSHVEEGGAEQKAKAGNKCTICLADALWQFTQPGKEPNYSCDDCKDVVAKASKTPAAEGPKNGVFKWQIERSKLKGFEGTKSEGTIAVRIEWDRSKEQKYAEGNHNLFLPFNAEGLVLLHMYEACFSRNALLQVRPQDTCSFCGKAATQATCQKEGCGRPIENKVRIQIHFKSGKEGPYGYPDENFFRYHFEMAERGIKKEHIISPSLRELVAQSEAGQIVL